MIAPKISTQGARLIAAERQRQISQEGYVSEHDDEHAQGELAGAAICYILHALQQDDTYFEDDEPWPIPQWPWAVSYWKPSGDPRRNLVKAGALIAAEIDRLTRAIQAEPDQDAHAFMQQVGSNLCVCGEVITHESHVLDAQPNPFDEHTRMWEDEIRGMGDDSRDPRGLPPFNPETLAEVQRWYESNGREKR